MTGARLEGVVKRAKIRTCRNYKSVDSEVAAITVQGEISKLWSKPRSQKSRTTQPPKKRCNRSPRTAPKVKSARLVIARSTTASSRGHRRAKDVLAPAEEALREHQPKDSSLPRGAGRLAKSVGAICAKLKRQRQITTQPESLRRRTLVK